MLLFTRFTWDSLKIHLSQWFTVIPATLSHLQYKTKLFNFQYTADYSTQYKSRSAWLFFVQINFTASDICCYCSLQHDPFQNLIYNAVEAMQMSEKAIVKKLVHWVLPPPGWLIKVKNIQARLLSLGCFSSCNKEDNLYVNEEFLPRV